MDDERRLCRNPYCGRPIRRCRCRPPLLGWTHVNDEHTVGSHYCGEIRRRACEPEPGAATTLRRFVTCLPRLPFADPPIPSIGDRAAEARAIDTRRDEIHWCAFCLVQASSVITVRAAELVDGGIRLLDLCAPHFADMRNHADGWDPADVIAAWERIHERPARR